MLYSPPQVSLSYYVWDLRVVSALRFLEFLTFVYFMFTTQHFNLESLFFFHLGKQWSVNSMSSFDFSMLL